MADKRQVINKGSGDAVYFFGMVGALVYYWQQAEGFGRILLAIIKAFVWPAFVTYDLLKFLS